MVLHQVRTRLPFSSLEGCLRPIRKSMVSSLDLIVVGGYVWTESLDLRMLSSKTILLLSLASAKCVGDLHVLSVHPCALNLHWMNQECCCIHIRLKSCRGHIVSSLSIDLEEVRRLYALCPVQVLCRYIKQMQTVCSSYQLFVCQPSPWEAAI